MATITITNLTSEVQHIGDLYADLSASPGTIVLNNRAANELDGMRSLKALILAGSVSVSVAYSAADVASGFTTPIQSVEPKDILPVAADGMTAGIVLRKAMVAAGPGAPDDVEIFAVGALPFKLRVVDFWAQVVTNIAGSLQLRDEAAGAGTLAGTVDSTTAGRIQGTAPSNATVVLTPGATKGLFIRRSDNGVDGEVFVLLRPES